MFPVVPEQRRVAAGDVQLWLSGGLTAALRLGQLGFEPAPFPGESGQKQREPPPPVPAPAVSLLSQSAQDQ